MNKEVSTEVSSETVRLLAALDDALDQSSLMRDLVEKYEHLHSIESVAGPSCQTRSLRQEIESMERELRLDRYHQRVTTDVN